MTAKLRTKECLSPECDNKLHECVKDSDDKWHLRKYCSSSCAGKSKAPTSEKIGHKPCSKCKKDKPLNQFAINRSNKRYGRTSSCKQCIKKALKKSPVRSDPVIRKPQMMGFMAHRASDLRSSAG